MSTWRTLAGAVSLFGLVALGCAGASPDESEAEDLGIAEQDVVTTNRLSLNRLSLNRLSLNGLSAERLSTDGLSVASTDLLLDAGGRELLRYVVRCALREDQQLSGTVNGATYTYTGLIGLAPQWLHRSLKHNEQRWISACLMAHVNGYGIEVPISLRGHHDALDTTFNERMTYTVQEISYYGNVFIPEDAADELGDYGPKMYACAGSGVQAACGANPATFGPMRACGGTATCGITFLGSCRSLLVLGKSACEAHEGYGFRKCLSQAHNNFGWPDDAYKQVITVYLKHEDFDDLYPGCFDVL